MDPKSKANPNNGRQRLKKVEPFYICEDGRRIPIQAVSMLEITEIEQGITAEYRERGEPIDPPTYTATFAGGDTKEYPLNENLLTVEGNEEETSRRMAAWALHSEALQRLQAEIGQVTLEVVLEDGFPDIEIPEAWIEKRKRRHIRIPTDPADLKKLYIMTEWLRSPIDIGGAQLQIIQLSTGGVIPEGKMAAARDTFFRAMEEAVDRPDGNGAGSESDIGNLAEEDTGALVS